MKTSVFIDKLISEEISDFPTLVEYVLDEYEKPEKLDEIRNKIKNIEENKITEIGNKVSFCIDACDKKLGSFSDSSTEPLHEKAKSFRDLLEQISQIIKECGMSSNKGNETQADADATAVDQNKAAIQELSTKVTSVQKQLENAVEKANDRIDSKIFSLLINTVAILGIFVAIAFSGFGVLSIISSLDVNTMMSSRSGFIKSVFFMLLIGFLSYNLLILLMYFLFKLSRPILLNQSYNLKSDKNENRNVDDEKRFRQLIRLKPFLIIDGVLFALTVAMFIASLSLSSISCPLLGF